MTDNFKRKASANAGGGKVVKLTARDVQNVRRLLSMFATNEPISIEPCPRTELAPPTDRRTLLAKARELLANRRRRKEIFGTSMFGEPAWDMLLLLYVLDSGQRQSVNRLSDLAGASRTTALRWIDYLEQKQLIQREAHPTDRRTVFLTLTDKARHTLDLYLSGTIGTAG